jgi:hypothetical protein
VSDPGVEAEQGLLHLADVGHEGVGTVGTCPSRTLTTIRSMETVA